ncbi:ExbD/TolR family protein [Aquimarina sediminis]|uniref:ExbD/TolR family protein n=1 Tax=Aquimarina sediminis TaxID=2070536 RepID=UPI000CA05A34|nr:biopolymer transporter ExbD [Aquimarina sediminis]
MSILKNKRNKALPEISTASLPDIVFMLLFFFMVATVIRENVLMVENEMPMANQIEKLDKSDLVMYIYAGKPSSRYRSRVGDQARIQLNDKFADVGDIKAFVMAERASRTETMIPFLTTALRIDKFANMGLVGDIKNELREVNALKINYNTRIDNNPD